MRYNARNSITGRESTGKGNAIMKSKTEFPDYKKLSVADLVPYARNSRTHSPQQVDKIARWQDFTGQQATLEESGETFNALAAKRIAT